MSEFFVEKAALLFIAKVQESCKRNKVIVSKTIRKRSMKFGVQIPKEILKMMCQQLEAEKQKKFKCKFCSKVFKEGRQLGGHISRAHKNRKEECADAETKKQQNCNMEDSLMNNAYKNQRPRRLDTKQKKIKKVTEQLRIKRKPRLQKSKKSEKSEKQDEIFHEDSHSQQKKYFNIKEEDQKILEGEENNGHGQIAHAEDEIYHDQ